ncbi:hypothetical protein BCR33DRAFT_309628 [Rhizoclosmatium globosum]|uniref:Uncharacterized protein n=1 Tax=Rhizoclosmatium globosum TaxID=329046 RepID=A0A1Y2C5T5_9FUNG|nr:hypothetical protein BCR33DRAFT_309628 [Rhizoclosmatium globosum]|eukprot:ORY42391.1 hypothetical protein BCR33DRAFT_309628 [Rhizoclosmatium globosum]
MLDYLTTSSVATRNTSDLAYENFKIGATFNIVFFLASLFLVFVTWDGILHQNILQLISVYVLHIGLTIYSITQIFQTYEDLNDLDVNYKDSPQVRNGDLYLTAQVMVPIVIVIFQPVFIYLTIKCYREFAWRRYRITGGSKILEKVFINYNILLLLIKYTLFFGFGLQIFYLAYPKTGVEGMWALVIFSMVFNVFNGIVGFFSIRKESKPLAVAFIIGCTALLVVSVTEIYLVYSLEGKTFDRVQTPLIFSAVLGWALLASSVVFGILCVRNFGKGLRDVLDMESRWRKGLYRSPTIDLDA